jgi:hypothetical protein
MTGFVAVRKNIEVTDIKKSKNVELIFGTIQLPKGKKMVIAAYYRPPNRTDEVYLMETYNELLDLKQTVTSMFFLTATNPVIIHE